MSDEAGKPWVPFETGMRATAHYVADDGRWYVQCIDIDIMASGPSKEEAIRNAQVTAALDLASMKERGTCIGLAPEKERRFWEENAKARIWLIPAKLDAADISWVRNDVPKQAPRPSKQAKDPSTARHP